MKKGETNLRGTFAEPCGTFAEPSRNLAEPATMFIPLGGTLRNLRGTFAEPCGTTHYVFPFGRRPAPGARAPSSRNRGPALQEPILQGKEGPQRQALLGNNRVISLR